MRCVLGQSLDSVVGTCSYWDLKAISIVAPKCEFMYLAQTLMLQGPTGFTRSMELRTL